MAREYPRFLYSNPHNTKSKGPFIVHTLFPKFIAQIITVDCKLKLDVLEVWDICDVDAKVFKEAYAAMDEWAAARIFARALRTKP